MLLLWMACAPDPHEAWLAERLAAERERASAATADEVCRRVLECRELRQRRLPADADLTQQMEAAARARSDQPRCEAYDDEALKRGLMCRRMER